MDVEGQRDVLLDAIQQQYKDNVSALEANRRLADEKISYNNEARGTYYSGQPTWERAQLAVDYGNKMNDLNSKLLKSQDALWGNISDYLDKINAYKSAASGGSSDQSRGYSTNLNDYYSSERGYQFVDPNGNPIKASTWAKGVGYNIWDVIEAMAKNNDINAKRAWAGYNTPGTMLTDEERRAFELLGIDSSGYGRRD